MYVSHMVCPLQALQKQLGTRLQSRTAVTKASKAVLKQQEEGTMDSEGERAALKKKLQDLDQEWENVCSLAVQRQSRLEDAAKELHSFLTHVSPLQAWMDKATPSVDTAEPVFGDEATVESLIAAHKVLTDLVASCHFDASVCVWMWVYICVYMCVWVCVYVCVGGFVCMCGCVGGCDIIWGYMSLGAWIGGDGVASELLLLPPQDFQTELDSHQTSFDSANATGQHLVAGVLDDPALTEQALQETREKWEELCHCSAKKQEMLDIAFEVCNICEVWER